MIFNLVQALDKAQLGDVIRGKEQKLDTPGLHFHFSLSITLGLAKKVF